MLKYATNILNTAYIVRSFGLEDEHIGNMKHSVQSERH